MLSKSNFKIQIFEIITRCKLTLYYKVTLYFSVLEDLKLLHANFPLNLLVPRMVIFACSYEKHLNDTEAVTDAQNMIYSV